MEYIEMLKEHILTYLDSEGRLKIYPGKRRPKLYALCYLAEHFDQNKIYSEEDVNLLLLDLHMFNDAATLRREMYNLMLLNRSNDGRQYTLNKERPNIEYLLEKYCK